MKSIYLKINPYLRKIQKKTIILFLIFSLFILCSDPIIAYLSGKFIDLIVAKENFNTIIVFSIMIISFYIISTIIAYFLEIIIKRMSSELVFFYESDIIKHLQKIPLLDIKKYDPAYLIQRIHYDAADIVNFSLDNNINICFNWFLLVMMIFYIGTTNFKAMVIFALFIPIYSLIYIKSKKTIYEITNKTKEAQGVFHQKIYDQINLVEDIKIDATFKENEYKLLTAFNSYINDFMNNVKFTARANSLEKLISYIFYSVLLIIGAKDILKGNLTVGEFTIINAYFTKAISIVRYYLDVAKNVERTKVSVVRMNELISIKEEKNGFKNITDIDKIELKDISYKYPDNDKQTIGKMTIKLTKGNIYAILGGNGAGKSTLLKIMLGIIALNEDKVFYNSIPLREIDQYSLRRKAIGVINQEYKFGYDRIRDIIFELCEKENKDLQQLMEEFGLVEMFENEDFSINNLLEKYPNELSGGEFQKVYLLRMLLKAPTVLVLDEPSTALDSISIEKFKELLRTLKENRIIILVTHEKEFIEIADEIFKIEN